MGKLLYCFKLRLNCCPSLRIQSTRFPVAGTANSLDSLVVLLNSWYNCKHHPSPWPFESNSSLHMWLGSKLDPVSFSRKTNIFHLRQCCFYRTPYNCVYTIPYHNTIVTEDRGKTTFPSSQRWMIISPMPDLAAAYKLRTHIWEVLLRTATYCACEGRTKCLK